MAIERWSPSRMFTRQEQFIMKRLKRTRKLFAFLREVRHELFDDAFQAELETMYRDTGAGKPPLPPAKLAMAALLQGYLQVSDAEAVELTMLDLRWQMVLDCLGSTEPLFSQGALCEFRQRLIRHDLDRRLLERTVEQAKRTAGFDWKKLPKDLRVAIDSSPLVGAGRVEDTVNLLAHAGRKIVDCVAAMLQWPTERVCQEAGIPLLASCSIKAALDYTWTDPDDRVAAVTLLHLQLTHLEEWLRECLPEELTRPPLQEHVATLHQIMGQDLEPDPSGGGKVRIRKGVAEDRRVSVEDQDMRHGRKSKSKRFNGFKRHIATDLDTDLILACAITPANRPEEEGAIPLAADLRRLTTRIAELYTDRGYINAPLVDEVLAARGEVICRPWRAHNGKLFPKTAFTINIRDRRITCPAGDTVEMRFGSTVEFDPERCDECALRDRCTDTSPGHGRTVAVAENEQLQQRLRKLVATRPGRARLRERVPVEHRLAHISRRQGNRARYRGVRNNVYDLRRMAAIQNLETVQRRQTAYATMAKAA